jgi:hypothetical protein
VLKGTLREPPVKTITIPKGWYRLHIGDVTRKGDKYHNHQRDEWCKVGFFNRKLDAKEVFLYIRKAMIPAEEVMQRLRKRKFVADLYHNKGRVRYK